MLRWIWRHRYPSPHHSQCFVSRRTTRPRTTRFRSSWCRCRCTASWPGASPSRSPRSWGSTPPSPWRTSASTGSGRTGRALRVTSSQTWREEEAVTSFFMITFNCLSSPSLFIKQPTREIFPMWFGSILLGVEGESLSNLQWKAPQRKPLVSVQGFSFPRWFKCYFRGL